MRVRLPPARTRVARRRPPTIAHLADFAWLWENRNARGAGQTHRATDSAPPQPRRTPPPGSLPSPRRLGFGRQLLVFSPLVVCPLARKTCCCAAPRKRASLGSQARRSPPQPGEHEDVEAEGTARAAHAGCLLSHPAPSPVSRAAHPTKCAGCVAHTHSGFPARGRGGRGGTTAATARERRAFSPRDTHAMPTHTASQLHMAHLAPHTHPPERHARRRATGPIRASRCVPALHSPFSHQCTRPASSHGEAAPPTARHSHCTAACSSLPTARKQVASGRRGGP